MSLTRSILHRRTTAVVAALGCVTLLSVTPATGSTPQAGRLTPTSGPITWTGGPFVTPNPTGLSGTVDCTAPDSCDDFRLTVRTAPGYGDKHQMRIETSWDNGAADFDVYLLDSDGNEVTSAASSSDPEVILTAPSSGVYTVRVVPFAPLGQSYSASATLVDKPNDTPPTSDAPTPQLRAYGAPESLNDAHNAGEPSIGVSSQTNSTFYQSGLSTYRVRFDGSVTPASAEWADVSANATKGCPQGSTTSLDPILYTDRATGRTFESQLSGVDSLTCYTDDEGTTWAPSEGGGIPSGVDHQTLGGGNFVANDPLNATNTFPKAVYYCSQDIATAFCALSRDGGATFGAGVPIYNLLDCSGLHGHVMTAPDGTTYVPNRSCSGEQGVAVSTDNGQTWTVRTVPGSVPSDNDPAVGIGANGTVYFGYANGDGTPHVAVSHDRGQTWENDFNVGAALGLKNVVFPTAVAGDDDRAAVSFIATKAGGNYQDIDNFHGVWRLYTAYTYDGGQSWVTVNGTGSDPVQRGSICTGGTTCGDDRNLLDFIGSTIDTQGRVEVGFADGCTDTCVSGGANNRDAYASIARQYGGLPLLAAFDPTPNLTVRNLHTVIDSSGGQSHIDARLVNIGTKTTYGRLQVKVDGATLRTSTARQLRPGQGVQVDTPWNTSGLSGSHTIRAVADPFNRVRESNEDDNRAQITRTFN